MSDEAAGASTAHTVAAHPPLSVAITTIGVIAVAMVGSTISSKLVDLDIAERILTKLPEHPGLGRARPQGPSGTQFPTTPAH
jgi:membrane fusion protein, multidrug efflux system